LFDPKIFATPDKPLLSGFYWTDEINAWELMGHQGGPLFANFVYDENGNTYNISSEVFVDPIPTPENWWDVKDDGKLAMFVIPENQPNGFIIDIKNGVDDVIDCSNPVFCYYLQSSQPLSLRANPSIDRFRIIVSDDEYNRNWLTGFVTDLFLNVGTFGAYSSVQVVMKISDSTGLTECSSVSDCIDSGSDTVPILVYTEKNQIPIIVNGKERNESGFWSSEWIRTDAITKIPGDRIFVVYSPKDRYITAIQNVVE